MTKDEEVLKNQVLYASLDLKEANDIASKITDMRSTVRTLSGTFTALGLALQEMTKVVTWAERVHEAAEINLAYYRKNNPQ